MRDQKLVKRGRKYQKAHIQAQSFHKRPTLSLNADPFPSDGVVQKKDDARIDTHSKPIAPNQ